MRKGFRTVLLILFLVLVVAAAGFVVWGETPARPMPEALAALQSDAQVTVTIDRWLVFTPTASSPTKGLILYPGGRVDYRAYAPAAHQIAAHGYLVVIVPMPFNLAVFGVNTAADVIAAYPDIQNWVIGGHSLGGAMAAHFANSHKDEISGLVLWAAYPASSDDLSTSDLRVTSISGTLDGLASGVKIDASCLLRPPGNPSTAVTMLTSAGTAIKLAITRLLSPVPISRVKSLLPLLLYWKFLNEYKQR